MHLLTPEKAKEGATQREVEMRARIRDLSLEESRLTTKVNQLRADQEAVRIEEAERTASFLAEKKAEMDALEREVASLEARKAEALKPTVERENAVAARESAMEIREGQASAHAAELKEKDESLTAQLTALSDKKQEQDERETELENMHDLLEEEKAQSKASAQKLAEEWSRYHITVAAKQKEMDERERELKHAEETRVVQLDERERRVKEREDDMEIREKKLASDQIVVQKAWDEYRRKQKTP